MGTTPTRGLPYPEMTDRVADGWAAIRDLALAVEHTIDDGASGAITRGIVDAAGDLIVGTGPDTVARLAKGAPGQRFGVRADGTVGYVDPTDLTPYADKTAAALQQFAAAVRADGGLYDGANRVYSAANPPPNTGGAVIVKTLRGTISQSSSAANAVTTATIASVVTAKSQLRLPNVWVAQAVTNGSAGTSVAQAIRVELASATSITMTNTGMAGQVYGPVAYELTEWS